MQHNDTSLYTSNTFSVSWFMWYMLHSSPKKNADSEKFLTCFKLITCECVRAQFKRFKKNESVENQMFLVTYERRKPSRNRNSGVKGASVQKKPVVFLYRCSLNLLRGSHWHHLWFHFFHDLANMQKGTLNTGLQVCGVHTELAAVQYYTSFGGTAVTETEEQEVNEFESWSENLSVRK